MLRGREPGTVSPSTTSSASIGVAPIQCFWLVGVFSSPLSESPYAPSPGIHQVDSKRPARSSALACAASAFAVMPADRASSA